MKPHKTVLPFLYFLFLSWDLTRLAMAQPTGMVTGVITDEKGQAAAQASVGDAKKGKLKTANAYGHYQLVLFTGRHKIFCSMVGYQKHEIEISISTGSTCRPTRSAEFSCLQEIFRLFTSFHLH